jgi:hypothetical protein
MTGMTRQTGPVWPKCTYSIQPAARKIQGNFKALCGVNSARFDTSHCPPSGRRPPDLGLVSTTRSASAYPIVVFRFRLVRQLADRQAVRLGYSM